MHIRKGTSLGGVCVVRLTGREELSVADVRTSHREAWALESDEEDNIPNGEIPLLRDRRLQCTAHEKGAPGARVHRSFRLTATLGLSAQPKLRAGAQAWAIKC